MLAVYATQATGQTTIIVKQVDHVLIASSKAEALFSLLADTLQFPVAWPLARYGNFASGGVALGNVNLEIIAADEVGAGAPSSRWTGLALEPESLAISVEQLDRRGIGHGAPAPFRSRQPDGSFATLWTTVGLPDVSGETFEVFLCQYADDSSTRRRRLHQQLRANDGGPLSAHSVKEIVVGARNMKSTQEQWQKLLTPAPTSPAGGWTVGEGPALRVAQADTDGIAGLVIYVESLRRARLFLQDHGILGAEQPGELTVAGSLVQGLNITLVEKVLN